MKKYETYITREGDKRGPNGKEKIVCMTPRENNHSIRYVRVQGTENAARHTNVAHGGGNSRADGRNVVRDGGKDGGGVAAGMGRGD